MRDSVGRGVTEGYLAPEEIDAVVREGLAALPVDGRRVLVIVPDGTRTMPMPLMFELIERELGPRVVGARLSRRARHAHAHERCAVERARRAACREWARRRPPDLQSPLGRPGHVRAAWGHTCARHRRHYQRPPATGRAGRRSIASRPSTITSSSAVLCFHTRSPAFPAARSTCFPASLRPRSFTSRTGSARSSPRMK